MRDKIKLVSSAGTGHYYTTTKNKRLHPDKMETKKFDPVARKHVPYKESKIKERPFAVRLASLGRTAIRLLSGATMFCGRVEPSLSSPK